MNVAKHKSIFSKYTLSGLLIHSDLKILFHLAYLTFSHLKTYTENCLYWGKKWKVFGATGKKFCKWGTATEKALVLRILSTQRIRQPWCKLEGRRVAWEELRTGEAHRKEEGWKKHREKTGKSRKHGKDQCDNKANRSLAAQ